MTGGFIEWCGAVVFVAPLLTLVALSFVGLTKLRTRENLIKGIVMVGQTLALLTALVVAASFIRQYFMTGRILPMPVIHHPLFSFNHHTVDFTIQLDGMNIWFVLMAAVLSNIVGVFSRHYLHRDPGFFRFFYLIVLFLVGVLIVFMGSTFQVIFMGWEFVGITSALLISFFTLRRETIDNALHAFWAYRISDIGLLVGSFLLGAAIPGYVFGEMGAHRYHLPPEVAVIIPCLLLFSAMGKSAQFPYSSWLPRAMEGPTSSSAIFYGGLSIHAGVFLLLRMRSELMVPTPVLFAMALVGIVSCVYGVLLSQVQSDVKSALAYASLSQVGIMFVEISMGWNQVAIVHCLGHAFLRTYQILKCSSIIHQFVEFEDAHQHDMERAKAGLLPLLITRRRQGRLFSFSFDLALRAASGPSDIVTLLERLSRLLQRTEEGWLNILGGTPRDSSLGQGGVHG
jgi:NADH-quinone oxidoreductase subunit L